LRKKKDRRPWGGKKEPAQARPQMRLAREPRGTENSRREGGRRYNSGSRKKSTFRRGKKEGTKTKRFSRRLFHKRGGRGGPRKPGRERRGGRRGACGVEMEKGIGGRQRPAREPSGGKREAPARVLWLTDTEKDKIIFTAMT